MNTLLFKRVRSCLIDHWDPIGIGPSEHLSGPEDEYDIYARDITHIIAQGGKYEELLNYLAEAEGHMGVRRSKARIRKAAKFLTLISDPPRL